MLAEILIYVPSIANYRKTWLEERLAAAQIAILAIEAAPDYMVSEMLGQELLHAAGVTAISRQKDDSRRLILASDQVLDVEERYDMRRVNSWVLIRDAFKTMLHGHPHQKLVEISGYMNDENMDELQIIFDEEILCHDMMTFSRNVLLLSIIISLITAGLVYFSILHSLIRPIKKITASMIAFRKAPEDSTQTLPPENRTDEIGVVMGELAVMQTDVRQALHQKTHLANLGIAVSKINHDLRNMLAAAQLVSDHLETVDDPVVKKLSPRFVKAIDRAIRLCKNTLQYGKAENEPPTPRDFLLHPLVEDVVTSLGLNETSGREVANNIPEDYKLHADTDQMFRVFLNLIKNAAHAMKGDGEITLSVEDNPTGKIINVQDNGPGIPDKILENLFKPFQGSSNGGSGLGLAIASEIVEAHGGHINLKETGPNGSCFQIILPA